VGGIPTVIADGETGLLVPVGDAAALRSAIERLLGDRALRERLGDAARARVEGFCSWPRVTDATLGIYASAVPAAFGSVDALPADAEAVLAVA
jgi:glycosyltransferase involved in cell wall biosynthesis